MSRLSKNVNFLFQTNSLTPQKHNKKVLRSFYKKRINDLSPALKKQKQKQIVDLLCKLPLWKKASYIAVYRALEDEPCLSPFCDLWRNKVCFPVIKDSVLEFYKDKGQWQKNSFLIFEPLSKPENQIPLDEISVFLIPGRAFDRSGGRLGRGKGYYDKALASVGKNQQAFNRREKDPAKTLKKGRKKKALFIGVAFAEQIHNERLPLSEHDILFDLLVTDNFVLKSLNGKRKDKIVRK